MLKSEQNLLDKIFKGRMSFSHDFLITLYTLVGDEMQRRWDEFVSACKVGYYDGIQDD